MGTPKNHTFSNSMPVVELASLPLLTSGELCDGRLVSDAPPILPDDAPISPIEFERTGLKLIKTPGFPPDFPYSKLDKFGLPFVGRAVVAEAAGEEGDGVGTGYWGQSDTLGSHSQSY